MKEAEAKQKSLEQQLEEQKQEKHGISASLDDLYG